MKTISTTVLIPQVASSTWTYNLVNISGYKPFKEGNYIKASNLFSLEEEELLSTKTYRQHSLFYINDKRKSLSFIYLVSLDGKTMCSRQGGTQNCWLRLVVVIWGQPVAKRAVAGTNALNQFVCHQ